MYFCAFAEAYVCQAFLSQPQLLKIIASAIYAIYAEG